MKVKCFLMLVIASLCLASCGEKIAYNDKIQDEFFGVKFGATKEEVIEKFSEQNFFPIELFSTDEQVDFIKRDDKYGLPKPYFSFGGMNWNTIRVYFVNNHFSVIQFNFTPESKVTALEGYDIVLEKVSSKYNIADRTIEDETTYKKSGGCTKDGKYIVVACYSAESQNKTNRNYITLEYGDESFQSVSNEL